MLINNGLSSEQVHATDLWQYTSLHEAASKARTDVCRLLLAYDANPYQTNCHGKSALDLAPNAMLKQILLYDFRGRSKCFTYNFFLKQCLQIIK